MTREILTAQIRMEIYNLLINRTLSPEAQKGCRKGSRGTGDLRCIDQHILNENKTGRKTLTMAWIDNRKAYDNITKVG